MMTQERQQNHLFPLGSFGWDPRQFNTQVPIYCQMNGGQQVWGYFPVHLISSASMTSVLEEKRPEQVVNTAVGDQYSHYGDQHSSCCCCIKGHILRTPDTHSVEQLLWESPRKFCILQHNLPLNNHMEFTSEGVWGSPIHGGMKRFGAAMAILNLLLRPLTSFMLYRIVQDRAGSYGTFGLPSSFEGIFGGPRRSPYEDIDQAPQNNPSTGMDQENVPTSSPSENLFTT